MKIIKVQVSLKGKIIQIHCTNNGFEGSTGCARERNKYEKNIKNGPTKHPKVYEKSMLNLCSKKRFEQKLKVIKNEIPKGSKILQKSIPKSIKK